MPHESLLAASPVLARVPIAGPRLTLERIPMVVVHTLLLGIDRKNLSVALETWNRMLFPVVSKQETSIDEMLGALPAREVKSLDFFFLRCRHPMLDSLKWHWLDGIVLATLPNLVTET